MSENYAKLLKSYLRHFLGAVLAAFIATGVDVFSLTVSDLKTFISAGVIAVAPVLWKALDSSEDSFGIGSK